VKPKLSEYGKNILAKLEADGKTTISKTRKVSNEEVANIKHILHLDEFTQKEIAIAFNLSPATIRDIKTSKSHKHIKLNYQKMVRLL
jgi:DNA invertase Pin-like site-specific DNA recombinase